MTDRQIRAAAKRARVAERRRWERCGAPVMHAFKRMDIRLKNQSNRWAQHGHPGAAKPGCDSCAETASRMTERGTA